METIKEFDFATLSDADKVVLYSKLHPLYAKSTLEVDVGLPTGTSVWIDCAGSSQGHIGVEDKTFRSVFPTNVKNTHFMHDMNSILTAKAIGKVYSPVSVVMYFAPFLRYMTPEEAKDSIHMYKKYVSTAEITVVIDIKFLLFHRFKNTNDDVVNFLGPKKINKFGTFKYLLKF